MAAAIAFVHMSTAGCNLGSQSRMPEERGKGMDPSHSIEKRQDHRAARTLLDSQIYALNLPTVQPDSFNYLAPLSLYQREKPYKCQLPGPCFGKDARMNNLVSQNYPTVISNVAGHEDLFTLDQSGFEFARCPLASGVGVDSQWSDDSVVNGYLPDLAQWLKTRLGCHDVFCYAYNFRRHGTDDLQAVGKGLAYDVKPPFFRVHCDASEATCLERLRLYFPGSYTTILQSRVRFLNIWRPISPAPVEDCPLALCDFRTVDHADLVPMDIVYPHFVDEAYEVQYNPAHRWFYKKGMEQDDVVVFKLFDSLKGEATVCPHSAFVDPEARQTKVRRASIEVKVIVVG
ncbi:hypothetical protein B0T24DRAFT_710674 [Lasiosphaeria ovina]|uniref:Uncharacterized protein n=1 Tax=Lasiosphaeria ovina TaxID=92902 RepID=A0AAE0JX02_9PEZI|nr:hypothetical protein B0T24DRAFT_710674 [Lasiosphaeria ovina]